MCRLNNGGKAGGRRSNVTEENAMQHMVQDCRAHGENGDGATLERRIHVQRLDDSEGREWRLEAEIASKGSPSQIDRGQRERARTDTNLDLDLTLPADLLAVGTVAPSLDKVPGTCVACQLYVRRYGRFLCDCQVGTWHRRWRRASEGVGFPLEGWMLVWGRWMATKQMGKLTSVSSSGLYSPTRRNN